MAAHAAWKAGLHYFEHMVKPAVNQQVSQVRSSLIWTMVSENNDFIEENQPESGGRSGWKRIWICSCIKQLWKFSLLYFLLLCSPCCSEDNAGNEHDPSQSINKYIFICVILCAAVALNAALVQAKFVKKKKKLKPITQNVGICCHDGTLSLYICENWILSPHSHLSPSLKITEDQSQYLALFHLLKVFN